MEKDKILKRNLDMVTRVIDKETIFVPIFKTSKEANFIYTMNPSASELWILIDGKRTLGEIKKIILEKFDTTPKEAEKEMAKFVKDLIEIKAIV